MNKLSQAISKESYNEPPSHELVRTELGVALRENIYGEPSKTGSCNI